MNAAEEPSARRAELDRKTRSTHRTRKEAFCFGVLLLLVEISIQLLPALLFLQHSLLLFLLPLLIQEFLRRIRQFLILH
jgi:hypothetical protein